jgi:hypothetical protein
MMQMPDAQRSADGPVPDRPRARNEKVQRYESQRNREDKIQRTDSHYPRGDERRPEAHLTRMSHYREHGEEELENNAGKPAAHDCNKGSKQSERNAV